MPQRAHAFALLRVPFRTQRCTPANAAAGCQIAESVDRRKRHNPTTRITTAAELAAKVTREGCSWLRGHNRHALRAARASDGTSLRLPEDTKRFRRASKQEMTREAVRL